MAKPIPVLLLQLLHGEVRPRRLPLRRRVQVPIPLEYSNVEYHFLVNSEDLMQSAVEEQHPGTCGDVHVARLPMGKTMVNPVQFSEIYRQLRQKYTNGSYHIFKNNCNHFSNELVGRLVGGTVPNWVFRLTDCLGVFSCCLPQGYLNAQWALADYKRKELETAMEYLPIRDRLKL